MDQNRHMPRRVARRGHKSHMIAQTMPRLHLFGLPGLDHRQNAFGEGVARVSPVMRHIISRQQVFRLWKCRHPLPVLKPCVPAHVIHYALRLVRSTRVSEEGVPDFVPELLSWGAAPRAVQYLILGAKAKAVMEGRAFATLADVKAIAKPVLRHRIITTFNAESNNITSENMNQNMPRT